MLLIVVSYFTLSPVSTEMGDLFLGGYTTSMCNQGNYVNSIVPNLFFKLTDLWPVACMLVTLDMLKILCLQCFVCVYMLKIS